MKPYYEHAGIAIYYGDCREVLPGLEFDSIDSIVCDPPYGLKFMGKGWDHCVPGVEFWQAMLQVSKPGAHLLAFGGTRTHHRLMCAIEDAGWEIRDTVMWVYGSGFPKSLDVSKAIDKAAGAEREVLGKHPCPATMRNGTFNASFGEANITAPPTDAAKQWDGWGTALKPAWEPIILARKPLDGTVAHNVLTHGVGALNIDATRIATSKNDNKSARVGHSTKNSPVHVFGPSRMHAEPDGKGRWPANFLHDGSDEVVGLFSETGKSPPIGSVCKSGTGDRLSQASRPSHPTRPNGHGDSGSAARFFYCAKSSKSERNEMPGDMNYEPGPKMEDEIGLQPDQQSANKNVHPTVKPLTLMRYLIRLITPPGGTVLDPFMGSGSTLIAAKYLGNPAIGIDEKEKYCKIAAKRLGQKVFEFDAADASGSAL